MVPINFIYFHSVSHVSTWVASAAAAVADYSYYRIFIFYSINVPYCNFVYAIALRACERFDTIFIFFFYVELSELNTKCRQPQPLIFKLQTPQIWRRSNDSSMHRRISKISNTAQISIQDYVWKDDFDCHFSIHKLALHRITVRYLWHVANACLAFAKDNYIHIQVNHHRCSFSNVYVNECVSHTWHFGTN